MVIRCWVFMGPQELSELAQGINFMLHRLDAGAQQLSQYSDDLAHELRTPINNLMGKAQVTLSCERTTEQYRTDWSRAPKSWSAWRELFRTCCFWRRSATLRRWRCLSRLRWRLRWRKWLRCVRCTNGPIACRQAPTVTRGVLGICKATSTALTKWKRPFSGEKRR